jgi:hypothetical protein
MKMIVYTFTLLSFAISTYALNVRISSTSVGRSKRVIVVIDFDTTIASSWKPDSSKYSLNSGDGDQVGCSKVEIVSAGKRLRCTFKITAANFTVFDRLISDSVGYYLQNNEPIELTNYTVAEGELAELSVSKIGRINVEAWKKYVLDEYSSSYLFPHLLKVGTPLGLTDSTKTIYFVELIQSDDWGHAGNWSIFWGLKGRWSTDREDRLNYAQLYPFTIFHSDPILKVASSVGIETGYLGFKRDGRAIVRGEVESRVPYNPIDFTLGNPRLRISPIIDFAIQGNWAWSDVSLPDSARRSVDVSCGIRYDVPVGSVYLLQSNIVGFYSTLTRDFLYRYDISLGYVVDGSIRIAAEFKQGYQNVTYQFDKQLLLGFVVDVLNELK